MSGFEAGHRKPTVASGLNEGRALRKRKWLQRKKNIFGLLCKYEKRNWHRKQTACLSAMANM